MKKLFQWILVTLVLTSTLTIFGYQWWQKQQSDLPDGITFGNGQIEANEVDISAKYGGRILDVLVHEGDMVKIDQPLVIMDTIELQTQLDRAKAELGQGLETVKEAEVQLTRTHNDLAFAQQQYERTATLLKRNLVAQNQVDERNNARDTAKSAVRAAEAHLRTLNKGIDAYSAAVRQVEVQISEARLTAPVIGRVLYRLAEPGEVVAGGGKVLTVLELSQVYMSIYLPAGQAGHVTIDDEARIVLDAWPELVIPATISFVAPRAQFTPKEVETRTEREKLMFRIKVQIAPELLKQHVEKVKTGVRGVAYVRLDPNTEWPDNLQVRLPQ